jgi:hypothetical protein
MLRHPRERPFALSAQFLPHLDSSVLRELRQLLAGLGQVANNARHLVDYRTKSCYIFRGGPSPSRTSLPPSCFPDAIGSSRVIDLM